MLCLSEIHLVESQPVKPTARIIHFGEDSCHRRMVLEGAGYSVEKCDSITEIESRLRSQKPPDAVVITDEDGNASRDAVSLANAALSPPVIVFANGYKTYPESAFDLVIPLFTSPANWLARIGETIERSRLERGDLKGSMAMTTCDGDRTS